MSNHKEHEDHEEHKEKSSFEKLFVSSAS